MSGCPRHSTACFRSFVLRLRAAASAIHMGPADVRSTALLSLGAMVHTVKFGSSSLTIPIRDSQHSGKECVLSLGRSPVEVAMAWMGGLALLSARSLAMPMRGLGCP